jgi:hypothetical protein
MDMMVYGSEQHILKRLAESPSRTINSIHIGRFNLAWRLWDAHLAREAPTDTRSMRRLKANFAICVTCYNLIRPLETLNGGHDRVFRTNRSQQWRPELSVISGLLQNCWSTGS